jgi:hypothetical protein
MRLRVKGLAMSWLVVKSEEEVLKISSVEEALTGLTLPDPVGEKEPAGALQLALPAAPVQVNVTARVSVGPPSNTQADTSSSRSRRRRDMDGPPSQTLWECQI